MVCIFCKESSTSSKSVEHIIPESIGNKRLVLPAGIVCDKCNNYFSSKVEKPVLSHQSMRNIRGWYQVPTKRGRKPSVKGCIAGTDVEVGMKLSKDNKLQIDPEKEKDKRVVDAVLARMNSGLEFPPIIFPIEIDPPRKEMSRFLAKMALETIAYRFQQEEQKQNLALEPHYDLIRNYSRYGSGVKEWPYHSRAIFPMDTEMRHPKTGEWVQAGFGHDILLTSHPETYFVFMLYGVEFVINLGGPSVKGYENWLHEKQLNKGKYYGSNT